MGRDQGLKEEKLEALSNYLTSPLFSSEERAVLRYADALTATPVEVPNTVFEALREFYNDTQIVELTSAIAWENYRARFDHALGVEAEGFSEAPIARCRWFDSHDYFIQFLAFTNPDMRGALSASCPLRGRRS